ncbi:MAG: metallophosphoesterase family protein [Pseudomonadota bacterium]
MFSFKQDEPVSEPREAWAPAGQRLYAIGDIHGRLDLLHKLYQRILEDAARQGNHLDNTLIYLGDYVDRGLNSKGVIDFVSQQQPAGFKVVRLMGNHEEMFLRFLQSPTYGAGWLRLGGDATLLSYGVAMPQGLPQKERHQALWQDLRSKIPPDHINFLTGLKLMYQAGDYVFVHAGIKPQVPLQEQKASDVMWIRSEFLSWGKDHEKFVIHGHSLSGKPDMAYARIGIDTGAYATNILTCLVLEDDHRRFLSTGD